MSKKKIKIVNHLIVNKNLINLTFIFYIVDINNSGTPNLVQLSMDFSNRVIPPHGNNSLSPEQALRFYTQYIHEVFTVNI